MSRATRPKHGVEMTVKELERIAAEFDQEFIADTFGPPPPDVRARLRRAKQKRGRPREGQGSKAISVTVEKSLLRQLDALARRKKVPRARLVARGLRAVLAAEKHSHVSAPRRRSRRATASESGS